MVATNEVDLFAFYLSFRVKNALNCSTYCHILQYNEDEIKSLEDVCFAFGFFMRRLRKSFAFDFGKKRLLSILNN